MVLKLTKTNRKTKEVTHEFHWELFYPTSAKQALHDALNNVKVLIRMKDLEIGEDLMYSRILYNIEDLQYWSEEDQKAEDWICLPVYFQYG